MAQSDVDIQMGVETRCPGAPVVTSSARVALMHTVILASCIPGHKELCLLPARLPCASRVIVASGVVKVGVACVGEEPKTEQGKKERFHISYPAFMTAPRAGIKN